MSRLRVVVVGCGSIGRRHARVLSKRSDVAVEGCDTSRDRASKVADEIGRIPIHTSFDDALASRPDITVIATPHQMHADQTVRALHGGSHVLCEKPMSDSVKDATRMLHAAQQSGNTLSIGFTNHFHPAMIHIKECIAAGHLGTVLQIHWHIGTYETLVNSVSRHQTDMIGALMMDYVHQPDLIHWWLDAQPETVFAAGHCGGDMELTSNPNVLSIVIQYQTATIATINLNYLQQPGRAYCEVIGDRGDIRFDFDTGKLCRSDYQTHVIHEQEFQMDQDAGLAAEHDSFIHAVKTKTMPQSPPQEAILATQLAEAAITSWQRKQVVRLTAIPSQID